MDFSLVLLTQNDKCLRVLPFTKAQNDNAEFLLCASNAFVAAVPFKLLGCFVLRTSLAVIMWIFALCENSK